MYQSHEFYLRRAIEISKEAREAGNTPFGALLVNKEGEIIMCISGFVVSGFEHSIANMGIFVTSYCLVDGLSIGLMLKNLLIVTLGNMVGGALLLAWPLRKMSADK